jgi:predicted transcriptional regulator
MRQKTETTHIRIPKALKEELNRIADSEQRDQIVVLTRMLTSPECLPVAIAKSDEVAA